MAQTKLLLCTLFITLVLSPEIPFSEGMDLNLGNKNGFPSLQSHNQNPEKVTKNTVEPNINLHGDSTNKEAYVHQAVRVSTTPMPPSQALAKSRSQPLVQVEAFRPTTPGHSPGDGNSLQI
ncbi:unnamed protein product [Ilex paraguariensis]|uniref:Uncharacterized protein n=1 Tax=Ilex paraguariensis TaxID=185542 RepID=A0ABC8S8I4_9AQUA